MNVGCPFCLSILSVFDLSKFLNVHWRRLSTFLVRFPPRYFTVLEDVGKEVCQDLSEWLLVHGKASPKYLS